MNILKDSKNSLLKRREIEMSIDSSGNPGAAKVVELIAEKFKVTPENVAVQNIHSRFGTQSFVASVFVYESQEERKRIEPKIKIKKDAAGGGK